ncbi:GTPase [Geitlerinema sp. P-1104]|uniref:dynamin family protein n=1 Tax=Geitlerinema sp. P-1104 TaxID=2546230 RepID=UPI001476891F|nr:dynamin family protein [Geitlerinema sp. P-1104]NMG60530.1 GTPase [Geitlerinema sp. P-1104]
MTQTVTTIFAEVETRAKHLVQSWGKFRTDMERYLPESYHEEIQTLSDGLDAALQRLLHDLSHPTLTLATTGTTSSGKSSLVNLLCGAEIMPVAVSEMSAGIVTIEHGPERLLVIPQTPDATWECGEWRGLSDSEFQNRLHDVMLKFIDTRERQPDLSSPQFYIRYPFRIASELQLPPGAKIKLMDLPGLASVGDEANRKIIQQQSGKALCLVTYNSAETDQQKIKTLLEEVVAEVKKLGGSPSRMLFILNRIDVFRDDKTWPESEARFTTRTVDSIKQGLKRYLPEYQQQIDDIWVIKLSTLAALLSLQIQDKDRSVSNQACQRVDDKFKRLIGNEILYDLPRNPEKWTDHDRDRVSRKLWHESHGGEFDEALKRHIAGNFPQLVLEELMAQFKEDGANAVIEWSEQTLQALLQSSKEKYDQEVEQLKHIRHALEQFLDEGAKELRGPFEELEGKLKERLGDNQTSGGESDIIDPLETLPEKLGSIPRYSGLVEPLIPLKGWTRELRRDVKTVLESVTSSLENRLIKLEAPVFNLVNYTHKKALEKDLETLNTVGYGGSLARTGKTKKVTSDSDKENLRAINQSLNQLSVSLSRVLENVIKQTYTLESGRMYTALSCLFTHYLDEMENWCHNLAPGYGINFPKHRLAQINISRESPPVNLKSGFPITTTEEQEAYEVKKEERLWWTLWLWKKVYYETQYRKRSVDNAEIPSAEEMLSDWDNQVGIAHMEIVERTGHWLLEQVNSLNANVAEVNREILDRYKSRLDEAHKNVQENQQQDETNLQLLQKQVAKLSHELSCLSLSDIIDAEDN